MVSSDIRHADPVYVLRTKASLGIIYLAKAQEPGNDIGNVAILQAQVYRAFVPVDILPCVAPAL